eukprot:273494_1
MDYLDTLWRIQKKQRLMAINLLKKIIENIINHPNEQKYKTLNCNKISCKINDSECCICIFDILLDIGFEPCENHKNTLILKSNNINIQKFKYLITELDRKMNEEKKNKSTVNMEHKQHNIKQTMNNNIKDLDDLVDDLISMGFTKNESLKALDACADKTDINQAISHCIKKQTITSTKNHIILIPPNDSTLVKKIMIMGYPENIAISALKESKGDIKLAMDRILSGHVMTLNSFGSIHDCCHLIRLKDNLKLNNWDKVNMLSILNSFNHLLFEHNSNDDFEFINDFLNTNKTKKCDIYSCISFHRRNRNYNNDKKETNDEFDERIRVKQQISDTIHCHFSHSFDGVFRGRLRKQKCNEFRKLYNNRNSHKFHQLIELNYGKNANNDYHATHQYSFGKRYYYWHKFKDLNVSDFHNMDGSNYSDWYISPKYDSFRTELTNNNIQQLTIEQLRSAYTIARGSKDTYHSKKYLKADLFDAGYVFANTTYFGIEKDSNATTNHLLSIYLYCSFDTLSYKFSNTFRRENEKESDKSLKKRHSNFYYFSKYLNETIMVFGNENIDEQHNV